MTNANSQTERLRHPYWSTSTAIILGFFALFIPGANLVLSKRVLYGFFTPIIGLVWVCICCWTRTIFSPTAFAVMLLGLLAIHVIAIVFGILVALKEKYYQLHRKTYWYLIALLVFNLLITVSCHISKSNLFGFEIFQIPSNSMKPTLHSGDIVVVNTWEYNSKTPNIGDVVVLRRTENGITLAKRISNIDYKKDKFQLYLLGDNTNYSVDSRKFGWVKADFLIGKVKFVWFSFKDPSRKNINIE